MMMQTNQLQGTHILFTSNLYFFFKNSKTITGITMTITFSDEDEHNDV